MTDISKELISYLKAELTGVAVYSGTIPESSTVPAVALYNVAFANSRVLSGEKTKNWSTWRLTVVASVSDLQNTLDQILLLDNTGNDIFRKLFFELSLIEPKEPIEPHQRAFVDIRVYPK